MSRPARIRISLPRYSRRESRCQTIAAFNKPPRMWPNSTRRSSRLISWCRNSLRVPSKRRMPFSPPACTCCRRAREPLAVTKSPRPILWRDSEVGSAGPVPLVFLHVRFTTHLLPSTVPTTTSSVLNARSACGWPRTCLPPVRLITGAALPMPSNGCARLSNWSTDANRRQVPAPLLPISSRFPPCQTRARC